MTDVLIVFCSCGDENEATRIGQAVVNEHLAACANILPPIRSLYRWQGNVEVAQEVLLLVKTTAERFDALRERIRTLHSYDLPEIIATRVEAGAERYLAWVRESVAPIG